jgi:hypothetical protein
VADAGLRGAPQQRALRMYTAHLGTDATRELLAVLQELRAVCVVNSEALRKLVKKWDRRSAARGLAPLSTQLLPDLYSAAFAAGTSVPLAASRQCRPWVCVVCARVRVLEGGCLSMLGSLGSIGRAFARGKNAPAAGRLSYSVYRRVGRAELPVGRPTKIGTRVYAQKGALRSVAQSNGTQARRSVLCVPQSWCRSRDTYRCCDRSLHFTTTETSCMTS